MDTVDQAVMGQMHNNNRGTFDEAILEMVIKIGVRAGESTTEDRRLRQMPTPSGPCYRCTSLGNNLSDFVFSKVLLNK